MKNKTAIKAKKPVKAAVKKKTDKKSEPVKKQSAWNKFNLWLYSKISTFWK